MTAKTQIANGMEGHIYGTEDVAHPVALYTRPLYTTDLLEAAMPTPADWNEFEDDLSDAIADSIDMDWNSRDGAKAVIRWLNENAPRTPQRD